MEDEGVNDTCLIVPDTEDQDRYPIVDGQYVVPDSEEEDNATVDDIGVEPLSGEAIEDVVYSGVDVSTEAVSDVVGDGNMVGEREVLPPFFVDYDHPDNHLAFEMLCDFLPGVRSLWEETKGSKS